MITQLNEEAALEFLREQSLIRLACVLENNEPYVVPVNYILINNSVYIHTLPGLKLTALRANPKACLEADVILDSFRWRSVIVFGDFEEVIDAGERTQIFHEFFNKFQRLTPVEAQKRRGTETEEIILFRIRITRISGMSEN